MSNMDVNLNTAKCLKTATYWTEEVVTNVCSGVTTVVPSGSVDILLVGAFGTIACVIAVGAVLGAVGFAISILRGY